MTKVDNNLLGEAAKAAALVKATAEATATSLNIQYIQKDFAEFKSTYKDDMVEIKSTLKEVIVSQDEKVGRLEDRIDTLAKMVWIGMGIALGFSFLSPILQKLLIR